MSGRTGERFTRCFDNAAAAEGIKTPAEGASSGRPTQSKLPECSEDSGRNKRPCDVSRAFPKNIHGWRSARDELLALQGAHSAARHSWLEVQGPLDAPQSERLKDALGLVSQARR